MIPFFSSDENWSRAKTIIDNWMGTPYRHMWMKRGRGIGCSLFTGVVLVELGIAEKLEVDHYPLDWFLHVDTEVIRLEFRKNIDKWVHPRFHILEIEGPPADLMRGDIIGFKTPQSRKATNHTGMLLDPPTTFAHSVHKHGVSLMSLGTLWKSWVTVIYRVMEK